MTADTPRISCLTITRNRPDRLKRCIALYSAQTWSNKELVIVIDQRGPIDWVDPFFTDLNRDDVRYAIPPPVEHLGALRNASVDMASGDYVCTWDDDDLYHPTRLEEQITPILKEESAASFLQDSLHYFEDAGELFLVQWKEIGMPASMLCRRSVLPRYVETISNPSLGERGSDTLVQMEILRHHKVSIIPGRPFLYTRTFHGSNVWNRWHHVLLAFNRSPDNETARRLIPGLEKRLREYFPYAIPQAITCKNGDKIPLEA